MATTDPSRVTDISGGTSYSLIDSPVEFTFRFNPEAGEARALVQFIQMLDVDGTTQNVNRGNRGSVNADWTEVFGATEFRNLQPAYAGATDPVTAADLTQISMRGVMQILLDMFDRMYVAKIAP